MTPHRCRLIRPVTIQPTPDHPALALPSTADYPWTLIAVDRGEAVLADRNGALLRVPERDVRVEVIGGRSHPELIESLLAERDALTAEVERLNALLATPHDPEPTWYANKGNTRVRFNFGIEDLVVTADRALSLGAALIRTALTAKESDRG